MLKKMRWRFIGAAMAAFTAVVLTLLCLVNLWNYHSVTSQQDEALTRLMEIEDQQMPFSSRRVRCLSMIGRISHPRCNIRCVFSPSTMIPRVLFCG